MRFAERLLVGLVLLLAGISWAANPPLRKGEARLLLLKPLFSFGGAGVERGKFQAPSAISSDPWGGIYVADTGNNRILKFDANGKLLESQGDIGWGEKQFNSPTDIWARNGLDVLVADYQNHRIQRYDNKLHYISSLQPDEGWEEAFRFRFPYAVCLSARGDLFLIEHEREQVIKIDSFGRPVLHFGQLDAGEGQLAVPRQIEIAFEDRVFISDSKAGCVRVFDYFGNYVTAWGKDLLTAPVGLHYWEPMGLLLVADPGTQKLWGFSKRGEPIGIQVVGATASNPWKELWDVTSHANRLYVLDRAACQIFVYQVLVK